VTAGKRQPSEHAGTTVKIRPSAGQLGGLEYRVEDWWINAAGESWTVSQTPAAYNYALRSSAAGLPIDDDVLYGKVGGFGLLVHISEIEVVR
jgi:hypothetical protein